MPSLLYAERPRCYPSSCRNSELREAHNTVYNSSSLPTCLAQRAIDRGRRHRVFACQTATKRHRTRHAASIRAHATMRIDSRPTAHQMTLLLLRSSSPASHAVQSTEPASAEYLPVRQPLNVTALGMQRLYVHMQPCA